MMDVFHYLFEEDMAAASGDQAKARSKVRVEMYRVWYGRDYQYAMAEHRGGGGGSGYASGGTGTSIVPEDGRTSAGGPELTHKPYIPPTDMNMGANPSRPFDGLDAPLG